MFEFNPIGYIKNSRAELYQLPYQVGVVQGMTAEIHLNKNCNFEEALQDLDGVERVWLVFVFHKAKTWKPKITPPRGGEKRSLFATRSPHRPNPIGMSAVRLSKVDGLVLTVEDHDLVDGTPILDIKPYIPEVDSYSDSSSGWLDDVSRPDLHQLEFSGLAQMKIDWLLNSGLDIVALVDINLQLKPWPEKGNRITQKNEYLEIAVKTWRLSFTVDNKTVTVKDIYSGYSKEYLTGEKQSKWDDVPLHLSFQMEFGS